jgi:hypothetical protein
MESRWNLAGKVVLGAILTMLPYQAWVLWHASQHTLPPWAGIFGLANIFGNVAFWMFMRNKLFARALSGEKFEAIPRASSAGLRIEKIHFSSIAYLRAVDSLPWYRAWFGILGKGFPRMYVAFGMKSAVTYFAVGSLVITPDEFTVSAAMVGDNFGDFCKDESKAFSLSFTPAQIRSVQRFDIRQITKRFLPFPYLRIQTSVKGAEDFLVGSGAFEFYDMSQETADLWAAMDIFLRRRASLVEKDKEVLKN